MLRHEHGNVLLVLVLVLVLLTLARHNVNQVDHVCVVEKLEDLDLTDRSDWKAIGLILHLDLFQCDYLGCCVVGGHEDSSVGEWESGGVGGSAGGGVREG